MLSKKTVLAMFVACAVTGVEAVELETLEQKYSYVAGVKMGMNIKRQSPDLDAAGFGAGIEDGLAGADPKLSEEEMNQVMQDWRTRQQEEKQKQATENLEKGKAFLEENKKREEVVVLPSGLQYEVLEAGEGGAPSGSAKVTVHYRGTLIDGTEFDSSHKRGQPATFSLNGVIKGFSEALSLMKPGAKWKVYIPSELGYGQRGTRSIAPNSTLIFELELISFESPTGGDQ
jgi:FKBP-type peptidyl-prolyl cis-trans isomerase